MSWMLRLVLAIPGGFIASLMIALPAPACCPVPPLGKPVVNADQTVIILWDAATRTEHFIRQASFKSDADNFGFLIPTPSEPELNESGDAAFPYLQKLTEPERIKVQRPSSGISCGCGSSVPLAQAPQAAVRVLQEKLVAGFNAVVLEADSADVLVQWLRNNGYAFSPEVETWAKPYVGAGWKITALKVAKTADGKDRKTVDAGALRMTFQTPQPLFPYREPDSRSAAKALDAKQRLLRIYFLAEGRYQGELTKEPPWTGKVAWAGALSAEDRRKVLELLRLPESTGPAEWWLTEFEDNWPYQVAPADLYFGRARFQTPVKRPPIMEYVSSSWPSDVMVYVIAAVLIGPLLLRRIRLASNY